MHTELIALTFRNMLFFQLLLSMVLVSSMPAAQLELLRIWKKLNSPLLRKRPARTNHKSNKFWEIDMTKLEP